MSYLNGITLKRPFDETVAMVRDALAAQGFGVLTEIDVRATMKAKLDAEIDNYLILGACNPPLAYRAIQAEPSLGVLLPCNVVVRSDGPESTVVEAVDPATLVDLTDNNDLLAVTNEVSARLTAVLDSLDRPEISAEAVTA